MSYHKRREPVLFPYQVKDSCEGKCSSTSLSKLRKVMALLMERFFNGGEIDYKELISLFYLNALELPLRPRDDLMQLLTSRTNNYLGF